MALATIPRPTDAAQLAPAPAHPTRREQTVLARQARRGNSRSRDELVLRNLRLVYAIARRYAGCGFEMDDVIQEGVAGLIRAVDKFDPERGVAFSTYAIWWIARASVEHSTTQPDSFGFPQISVPPPRPSAEL